MAKRQELDTVDQFITEWTRERPDLNFRHLRTLGRIVRLSAHLRERMDRWLAPFGFSWEIFDLLVSLRRSGAQNGLRPTDLYKACVLSSGATTNRINRAESRDLVARCPDPEDGRATRIALTARGSAVADRALTEHHVHMQRLSDILTPKEQAQLAGLLRKLLVVFEAPEESGKDRSGEKRATAGGAAAQKTRRKPAARRAKS